MPLTKALFNNEIRPELIQFINNAQSEITAAVAWFTDREIFNVLLKAINKKINIQLLIQDDEINRSAPFAIDQLAQTNVEIWFWNPLHEGIMHHKFAVIDKHTVISGSYNWTVAAANYNQESVIVFTENPSLSDDYLHEFNKLKQRASLHPICKARQFRFPTETGFKSEYRVKIIDFQNKIKLLEIEKGEIENSKERFTHFLQKQLYSLILNVHKLENELAKLIAIHSKKRTDQENFHKKEQEFKQVEAQLKAVKIKKELNEQDRTELKKMYRETISAIHPDLFHDKPELEKRAHDLCIILNKAYKESDLKKVCEIWEMVKNGTVFYTDVSEIDEIEKLKQILEQLENKYHSLTHELQTLQKNEKMQISKDEANWNTWIEEKRGKLKLKIEWLEKEIARYNKKEK